eukprot:CAMPEP_0202695180 /NCGR_PEP_ID=MMETSP1385-20130828/8839_1 /ASSEMBLY_ACC=CAM_ASM_000861 /TAXON_ID=933848 /ORGANISM="Elphidium margaritaceum" /LENGTH=446 /DNA_ID=CAMNT_0049351159 /DNA_START=37 /DNA_END=1377 /DNA_ORIENTATION=-
MSINNVSIQPAVEGIALEVKECRNCSRRTAHEANIRKYILDSRFSDVVFVIGPQQKEYHAARVDFARQSSYFADVLFSDQFNGKSIHEDVTEDAFEFIHEYCCGLPVQITVQNVVKVCFAAQKYQLEHLLEDCQSFIDARLRNNNIAEILSMQQTAVRFRVSIMTERFDAWLSVENCTRILDSNIFSSDTLSTEFAVYLIQHNSFSVKEQDVWKACRAWCEFKSQTSQTNWTVLMRDHFTQHIRFPLMNRAFFANHVYPAEVLTAVQFQQISLYYMDPSAKIDFIVTERSRMSYANLNSSFSLVPSQCLPYQLNIIGFKIKKQGYHAITSNDLTQFVSIPQAKDAYIFADFSRTKVTTKVHIVRMDIAQNNIEDDQKCEWKATVQYQDDNGNWIDWQSFTAADLNRKIKTVNCDIKTTGMRISSSAERNIAIGCWRFYGFNECVVP